MEKEEPNFGFGIAATFFIGLLLWVNFKNIIGAIGVVMVLGSFWLFVGLALNKTIHSIVDSFKDKD